MKTISWLAVAISAVPSVAWSSMAIETKCRGKMITVHPRPTGAELDVFEKEILPKIKTKSTNIKCATAIGEIRAATNNGGWEEVGLSGQQEVMGRLMNECCENK